MSPKTTTAPSTVSGPVSRTDIESKLRQIRGTAEETTPDVPEAAQRTGLVVGVVALLVVAFVLGRRRGRKKSTVVEIRRI
jgi:hypothetical protein